MNVTNDTDESKQDIQQIKRLCLRILFHEFPRFVDALVRRIRQGVDKFPFIVVGRLPGLVEPLIEPFSLSGILQLGQILHLDEAEVKAMESKYIGNPVCPVASTVLLLVLDGEACTEAHNKPQLCVTYFYSPHLRALEIKSSAARMDYVCSPGFQQRPDLTLLDLDTVKRVWCNKMNDSEKWLWLADAFRVPLQQAQQVEQERALTLHGYSASVLLALARARRGCSFCKTARGAKLCSGCYVVGYCTRECQAAHWRQQHSSECVEWRQVFPLTKVQGEALRQLLSLLMVHPMAAAAIRPHYGKAVQQLGVPFAVCLLVFGGFEGVQAMVKEIKDTGTVSVGDEQVMPLVEGSVAQPDTSGTKVVNITQDGWALQFMKPETVAQTEKTPEARAAALQLSRDLFDKGEFFIRPSFVEESGGIRLGIVSAVVPIQADAKLVQALKRFVSEGAKSI